MTLTLMPSQSRSQACFYCLLSGLLLSKCPSFHRWLPSVGGQSRRRLTGQAFLLRVRVHSRMTALSVKWKGGLCCCDTRGGSIGRSRPGLVCVPECRCCFASEEVGGGVGSQVSGGKCDSCYILACSCWGDPNSLRQCGTLPPCSPPAHVNCPCGHPQWRMMVMMPSFSCLRGGRLWRGTSSRRGQGRCRGPSHLSLRGSTGPLG